ncbi:MAG: single-stranded-DNA-specific exonuclease RecJ, partial [Maribacter sp.]
MRWTIKPKPEQKDIDRLADALGVEDLVAQLLLQRGISSYEEAKNFFRPQLKDLHDPFLMKDMEVAVSRI